MKHTVAKNRAKPPSGIKSIPIEKLKRFLGRFPKRRVLVVGDLMLDHFIWGDATHISPEAPIPVVKVVSESLMPGAAANVVNNICAMGGQASMFGIIGKDHSGKKLIQLLQNEGADTSLIMTTQNGSTMVKTRVIAQKQHIVRFDREMLPQHDGRRQKRILTAIEKSIDDFDAVILEDYGKGVLTQFLVDGIIELCHQQGKIVTADPKIDHYLDFSGATLITPNFSEAVKLSDMRSNDRGFLPEIARRLHKKWPHSELLITLGDRGMYLARKNGSATHIPTVAREVFDVAGAGDTVIAICTLALASGASILEAATIANVAAGIVVGKVGTATATQQELIETVKEMRQ